LRIKQRKVCFLFFSDLNHSNQYIAGLALCALGAISSAEMSRDLGSEVEKLMRSTNPYLKKKVSAFFITKYWFEWKYFLSRRPFFVLFEWYEKSPNKSIYFKILFEVSLVTKLMVRYKSNIEVYFLYHRFSVLLGVLLVTVTLLNEMCEQESECLQAFRKVFIILISNGKKNNSMFIFQLVPTLVRILKNLITSGYSPDHDVSGISDPFLQVTKQQGSFLLFLNTFD